MKPNQKILYEHMKEKLVNATVTKYPYEHIVIENFLPEEEYEKSVNHETYDRTDLSIAISHFREYFMEAFSELRHPEIKSLNLQLTEWGQGYSYRPHLDGGPRVVSMILYQPEHNNHPWLGTSFYDKVDNDFRLIDYVPYFKNTAVFFPCGFDHWHGNELQMEQHRRKAMLCFFYNQPLDEQHGWDMNGYYEYDE